MIFNFTHRPSITATLSSYGPGIFPNSQTDNSFAGDSLGSAGSLLKDDDSDPWEEQVSSVLYDFLWKLKIILLQIKNSWG